MKISQRLFMNPMGSDGEFWTVYKKMNAHTFVQMTNPSVVVYVRPSSKHQCFDLNFCSDFWEISWALDFGILDSDTPANRQTMLNIML